MTDVLIEMVEWTRAQFPRATKEGLIAKLKEEIAELEATDYSDPEEMADVNHVLAQLADVQNYSLRDANVAKLAKNKARRWPERPDENGVYSHVRAAV